MKLAPKVYTPSPVGCLDIKITPYKEGSGFLQLFDISNTSMTKPLMMTIGYDNGSGAVDISHFPKEDIIHINEE